MSLQFPKPPIKTTSVLKKGLIGARAPVTSAGDFAYLKPHPVYHLTEKAILAGRWLRSAKLQAWRYLIIEGDSVAASASLCRSKPKSTFRFSSLVDAPGGLWEACFAIADFISSRTDFEIRSLSIPFLNIGALWLHASNHGDQFVILPPSFSPFHSFAVYSEIELKRSLLTAVKLQSANLEKSARRQSHR